MLKINFQLNWEAVEIYSTASFCRAVNFPRGDFSSFSSLSLLPPPPPPITCPFTIPPRPGPKGAPPRSDTTKDFNLLYSHPERGCSLGGLKKKTWKDNLCWIQTNLEVYLMENKFLLITYQVGVSLWLKCFRSTFKRWDKWTPLDLYEYFWLLGCCPHFKLPVKSQLDQDPAAWKAFTPASLLALPSMSRCSKAK